MIQFSKSGIKLALLAFIFSGTGVKAQSIATVDAAKSKAGAQAAADHTVVAAKTTAVAGKKATAKPADAHAHHHHHKHHAHKHHDKHAHHAAAPVAEKHEPKIMVEVHGQITPEVAFVSNLKPEGNKNLQGYNFGWNNAQVNFKPIVKTDSSFVFSAVARLDVTAMTSLPTAAVNGPVTANTPSPFAKFTRLYAQIDSDYGRIQLGNLYGPQVMQIEGVWSVFYGGYESLDRIYNPYNFLSQLSLLPKGVYTSISGSMNYFNSVGGVSTDPARSNKIVYESPSFGGFKLSAMFSPRVDEVGSTFSYTNNAIATPSASRVQNSWFIVPSFKRKLGNVELSLMGSYGQGTAVTSDGSAHEADTHQDPKLWNVSGGIKSMGFELGGAYSNTGTSLLSKDQINAKMDAGSGWNVAAAYNFSKAKIGVAYMSTRVGVADKDFVGLNAWTVYADYKLADGVKILISENYITGQQATTDAGAVNLGTTLDVLKTAGDTAANVLFIGLDIKF